MSRALALMPLVALAALAALFLGYALKHDPRVEPAALVGRPAPRLALAPLDGGPAAPLAVGAGRPVLVNFFASWCVPCAEEAPALMALKAQGVPILGVAYKDDPVETRRFLGERGDPFAGVRLDPDARPVTAVTTRQRLSGTSAEALLGAVKAKYGPPLYTRNDGTNLDWVGRDPANRDGAPVEIIADVRPDNGGSSLLLTVWEKPYQDPRPKPAAPAPAALAPKL